MIETVYFNAHFPHKVTHNKHFLDLSTIFNAKMKASIIHTLTIEKIKKAFFYFLLVDCLSEKMGIFVVESEIKSL